MVRKFLPKWSLSTILEGDGIVFLKSPKIIIKIGSQSRGGGGGVKLRQMREGIVPHVDFVQWQVK
jgi:hypothetical protein